MQFKKYIYCFWIFAYVSNLLGQSDYVRFINPGFEGDPKLGCGRDFYLKGWSDCSDYYNLNESPPDIHPGEFWEVDKSPAEGKTYIGMVTRDNGTYEIISTKLKSKLLAGFEYEFSVHLTMSDRYISRTRMTNLKANYYNPVVLVVFGSSSKCKKGEYLFETEPIENKEWRKYFIRFKSKDDCKYLTFAAFYKKGTHMPYNGHLLIDGLSNIVKIND